MLVCETTVGGCRETGSAFGELGPNTRSPLEGMVACVSAFERSRAVSRREALSGSVLRTLDVSRFLLPSDPKKDRFLFSLPAAFLAWRPEPMTAVGPSPEAARSEPVARANPSGLVVVEALAPFVFGFEGVATFSIELSSRSVDSPSSIRLGIPRTGVNSAGSSSLESAKRLLKFGRPSSSSLESPKRLEKRELGFESAALGLEALLKPNREGDFARFESIDPRRVVRAGFPESMESRIDVRIPLPPGPAELNGRRAMEPVGDDVRPLND